MAVSHVEASKTFFGKHGFEFDPRFTGNAFANLIISKYHDAKS